MQQKTTEELYRNYGNKMQKIADVKYAAAVLGWDQETYLPEKGAQMRSRQLATLSGIAHEWFADEALGTLLQRLSQTADLPELGKRNVARTLEDYEKNKKYSPELVHELSMTTSECYHAWIRARKENDYTIFQPSLQKMIRLKQKEADVLGYADHPYDALLDDFEKGATVKMLDAVFQEVKSGLKDLLEQIKQAPQISSEVLHQHFDKKEQWEFGLELLRAMGFDFSAGRQDISEHPFTTNFNSHDVRITTRIDERDFGNMIWSCIHEGGHALYEQGLPEEQYGLPGGEAASLAIHESQSRIWENNAGRSKAYWEYFYPELQRRFPEQFADVGVDDFYKIINKVQPSLIRTEADELTYHFHIMIRYELEKKLIDGTLDSTSLKEAWDKMYQTYLGLQVPDDRSGILQDIHWSHGSFGYFPTYSLGSFYAAQFFDKARQSLPDLEEKIASGNLEVLLQWLRKNIHQYGRLYTAEELCIKITGHKLDFSYFMSYAYNKYKGIYGLK